MNLANKGKKLYNQRMAIAVQIQPSLLHARRGGFDT